MFPACFPVCAWNGIDDSPVPIHELWIDLRINYQFNNDFSFNFGSNNLFNVMPDENKIGNSRAGTIEDASGNIIVSSLGVFTYSRRSAPFGFNGAYYYAGITYKF